jgi:hypothetical protein
MEQLLYETPVATAVIDDEPISASEMAAFIDGRLSGDELARMHSRLGVDTDARKEFIESSRIIGSAPRRNRIPIRWLSIGAVAAAAAIIVFLPTDNSQRTPLVATERRTSVEATDRVELLSPADGESFEKTATSLSWRSIDGATYRVVLSDPTGRILFAKSTTDTVVVVPANLLQTVEHSVYWSVDALAPDGSSVTSGVRELIFNRH